MRRELSEVLLNRWARPRITRTITSRRCRVCTSKSTSFSLSTTIIIRCWSFRKSSTLKISPPRDHIKVWLLQKQNKILYEIYHINRHKLSAYIQEISIIVIYVHFSMELCPGKIYVALELDQFIWNCFKDWSTSFCTLTPKEMDCVFSKTHLTSIFFLRWIWWNHNGYIRRTKWDLQNEETGLSKWGQWRAHNVQTGEKKYAEQLKAFLQIRWQNAAREAHNRRM